MLFNVANYEKYDPHVAVSGVAQLAFPAVTAGILKKPRHIVVQASSKNTGMVYVGKTGVKADLSTGGYEIAPGQMLVLPGHMIADWFHIADLAAQTLFITYLAGEY